MTRELTSAHVLEDLGRRVVRNPGPLGSTLLRSKAVAGREILAWAASEGHLSVSDFITLGVEYARASEQQPGAAFAPGSGPRPDAKLTKKPLLELARALALQTGDPVEAEAGRGLLALALEVFGSRALGKPLNMLYIQLLDKAGMIESARTGLDVLDLDEPIAAVIAADLDHPSQPGGATEQEWLQLLSKALNFSSPMALREGDEPRLDRLYAPGLSPITHPNKITVVMSAYEPDGALLVGARSIIEQTWQNWELLIVDDASKSAESRAILAQAEQLDPRITVIRKAVNGGTYRARNTAMRLMTGDFFTCLDSDDWANPRRLEAGIRPLLADPSLMATRSQGIRATDDLVINKPGYPGRFPAASSLMVRAYPAMSTVGFFDPVRKAADTEYDLRVQAAFGVKTLDVRREVHTILRSREDSLSAGDFSRGWRHPARPEYKAAYGRFHTEIAAGDTDPFVPASGQRRFPAPHLWSAREPLHEQRHFDIIIAGDWRRLGGPQHSMLAEIAAARHAGWRVGVMHIEAMRFAVRTDDPLCAPLQDLISAGEVELVHLDESASTDVLLLRYPPILQFPPQVPCELTIGQLFIMANQSPCESDGTDQRYVPADVSQHARDLFGQEPLWIPQGPNVREVLAAHLPAAALTSWDNPGLVNVERARVRPTRPVGPAPQVVRYSRDDAIKFPLTGQELRTGYDFPEPVQVTMMGAPKQIGRLLGEDAELPTNWTILPMHELPVSDLLAAADVMVYLDNPQAREAFGRVLLEGISAGVPVVTSPKHRDTFGDAALYAEPEEAVAVTMALLADPQAYQERVELGLQRVRERWSEEHFVSLLSPFVATPPQETSAQDSNPQATSSQGSSTQTSSPASTRTTPSHPTPSPAHEPEHGIELTVAPTLTAGVPAVIASQLPPGCELLEVPIRRPADGLLRNHLLIVHDMHSAETARAFARSQVQEIEQATTPGHLIGEFAPQLPQGVHGVAAHIDGRWSAHGATLETASE